MKSVFPYILLLLVVLFPLSAPAAVTLGDAASLWRFDMPQGVETGSTVTAGQIKDSSGTFTATTISGSVMWSSVSQPAQGAIGASTSGVSFNPVTAQLNPGSANFDSIQSSLIEINNANVPVRGNSTLLTRIFWDGRVSGSDDGPNGNQYWLVRNGYSGSGQGFLFGLRTPDVDPNVAVLQYFTYQGAGGTSSVSSSFSIQKGVWYDLAIVMNDGGELSTYADNQVSFYAYSQEYGFQTSSHTNMYISGNPTSVLYIGSEDKGTSATGNQRKSFDGSMDYLALFNQSLSGADVQALMIPEPSRSMLMFGFILGSLLCHRRRS